MSTPISAEARGRVRTLLARLQADTEAVIRAVDALPPAMVAAASAGPLTGRSRAVDRIVARLPIPPLARSPRSVAWRLVRPTADGVTVEVILLGSPGRTPMTREPFGLVISRHALGRLIERSARTVEPVTAIIEAHNAMLTIPVAEGHQMFDLPNASVPAAGGVFLCLPKRIGAENTPIMVARTWVGADQAFEDQHLDSWKQLLATCA